MKTVLCAFMNNVQWDGSGFFFHFFFLQDCTLFCINTNVSKHTRNLRLKDKKYLPVSVFDPLSSCHMYHYYKQNVIKL